jgi:hypothetical protein
MLRAGLDVADVKKYGLSIAAVFHYEAFLGLVFGIAESVLAAVAIDHDVAITIRLGIEYLSFLFVPVCSSFADLLVSVPGFGRIDV